MSSFAPLWCLQACGEVSRDWRPRSWGSQAPGSAQDQHPSFQELRTQPAGSRLVPDGAGHSLPGHHPLDCGLIHTLCLEMTLPLPGDNLSDVPSWQCTCFYPGISCRLWRGTWSRSTHCPCGQLRGGCNPEHALYLCEPQLSRVTSGKNNSPARELM